MDAGEKALLGFLENDKNQKKLYIVQIMAGNSFARMEKRCLKALKMYPAVGSNFISAASRRAVDRKRNALKYLKEAVFCTCGNSVCELAAVGEIDLG